jgi:anti-sigma factor RsiW
MICKDFREIADSYLSNELLVETNHEVLRHLENCADCRRELAARRDLREKLREAVMHAPQSRLNENFASRLTNDLREKSTVKPGRWSFGSFIGINPALAGVLAVLFLTVSIVSIWKFRQTESHQQTANLNPTPSIDANKKKDGNGSLKAHRASFKEMEKDAVGDHRYCALKFSLPEKPISLDKAAMIYGAYNKDLDKAVFAPLSENLGDKIKFLEAHSCIINGRQFAHVVLKYQERVISVLVARRDTETEIENGDAISCQTAEDLRVACFQTAKFGVFVVSDLEEAENLRIARMISASVKKHFEQSEVKA